MNLNCKAYGHKNQKTSLPGNFFPPKRNQFKKSNLAQLIVLMRMFLFGTSLNIESGIF